MSIRILGAALALALSVCASAMAASLDAYGRLPTLDDVTISPDGSTLAFATVINNERMVLIDSLQPRAVLGGLKLGDAKLRALTWADNKHLLLTTSTTASVMGLTGPQREWFMAQCFNVDTRRSTPLLENVDPSLQAMNVIEGPPQLRIVDGRAVAYVEGIYFPERESHKALFKVDLDSGHVDLIKQGRQESDWVVDPQGDVIAQIDYRESSQRWTLSLNANGSWIDALVLTAPIDTPTLQGLTYDGGAVVVAEPNNGQTKYVQVSLKDGSVAPVTDPRMMADEVVLDRLSNRIIGAARETDKTDYQFYLPRAEVVWKSIAAAYPHAVDIELVSATDDWNTDVVEIDGPYDGDYYDLVDMKTLRADPIGPAYDGIGPADFADVKWITYSARDGRSISGYLTLPKNRDPKNLPLVVLPHGGPFARDEPGFDWLSQGLASRGYAVLQPQYRGSAGFGWDLLSAGFGQFGRKMQTDLSDGVRDLAAKGIVDPKRVCIVGASYGGYAALAGATLDPGVYRCAVSDAGLSDLREFMRYLKTETGRSDSLDVRFWDRFLGVTDSDDSALDAISPIKHIENVNIPILLIHGRSDTVVPIAQSEDMADALKKAGKPVEFVELDGEDHWLSHSETRLQMLEATVKFLEANNPPN